MGKNIFSLCQQRTVITAEIGINHNGQLPLALELIDAAAEAGVDAVKFQGFHSERMYSRFAPGFSHTAQDVFSQIKALEIHDEWWAELRRRADEKRIFFSASLFDDLTLAAVAQVGVDYVKIASSEITHWELIEKQKTLSPIFVISTGMALLDEIARLIQFLRGLGLERIVLLECTSLYPALAGEVHLLNIDFLRETFHAPCGYSDHTIGTAHMLAAVARGSCWLEKHFTLDKNLPGPDHRLSADVAEMKMLVTEVREIEQALKANGKAEITARELKERGLARRSVTANRVIERGEIIQAGDCELKRPGLGIPPDEARFLWGRRAATRIEKDHWLTWDMVE